MNKFIQYILLVCISLAHSVSAEDKAMTRSVITGFGEDGQSVFVEDGEPKLFLSMAPGAFMGDLWKTETLPRTHQDGFQPETYALEPHGAGGVSFRIISIPPSKTEPDTGDTPEAGMHQTNTIDFITIVEGEIYAVMDSGEEKLLKQGDTMIQRGTNHAWINRSGKPCIFSAVMLKPAITGQNNSTPEAH